MRIVAKKDPMPRIIGGIDLDRFNAILQWTLRSVPRHKDPGDQYVIYFTKTVEAHLQHHFQLDTQDQSLFTRTHAIMFQLVCCNYMHRRHRDALVPRPLNDWTIGVPILRVRPSERRRSTSVKGNAGNMSS